MMLIHQRALNEMGLQNTDINGPVQYGTQIAQATINLKGQRSSTANSYLDPNPFPQNLHIITRAFVTKVLFDKTTTTGVEFIKYGKMYDVKASKEVILSAGNHNYLDIFNDL